MRWRVRNARCVPRFLISSSFAQIGQKRFPLEGPTKHVSGLHSTTFNDNFDSNHHLEAFSELVRFDLLLEALQRPVDVLLRSCFLPLFLVVRLSPVLRATSVSQLSSGGGRLPECSF